MLCKSPKGWGFMRIGPELCGLPNLSLFIHLERPSCCSSSDGANVGVGSSKLGVGNGHAVHPLMGTTARNVGSSKVRLGMIMPFILLWYQCRWWFIQEGVAWGGDSHHKVFFQKIHKWRITQLLLLLLLLPPP
jgi:hypothetical protein